MSEDLKFKDKLSGPKRLLRRLKLDRVDFVGRGANPDAHITFFKAGEGLGDDSEQGDPADGGPTIDSMPETGTETTRKQLASDLRRELHDAARERWGADDTSVFVDDFDVDENYAIVAVLEDDQGERLLKVSFERSGDGMVTFGDDETEVEQTTQYETKAAKQNNKEAGMPQENEGQAQGEEQGTEGQSLEEQVDALKQQVETLQTERDEAQAEVEKTKQGDGETGSEDAEVRKELEAEVERLRKAERRRTFVEKAREFDGLGQPERIATLLEEADENLSEEAQDILSKMLKAAAAQENAGELFKQLSDPDAEPDKTPVEKLNDMARERMAKSDGGLTFEQAQVEVANENPDLKREVYEVRS